MKERIESLQKKQDNLQKFSAVLIILSLIGFALLFFSYSVGILLFLVVIAAYVFGLRKGKKNYKKEIKRAILEESFKQHIRNVNYTEKDGMDKKKIADSGLIPVEKVEDILVRDTVKGTYQNCPVSVGEVTVNFHSVKEKKNGQEKDYIDYMAGVYFDIKLPSDTGKHFMLWKKDVMAESAKDHFYADWTRSVLEDEKLKNFEIYLPKNTAADAQSVLAKEDKLLKAFYYLADYTTGQPALQMDGDHLRLFVRTRFLYTIEVPVRTEINAKLLGYLDFSELTYLLRVADTQLSGKN